MINCICFFVGQPYSYAGDDLYDYESAGEDLKNNTSDNVKEKQVIVMKTPQFTSTSEMLTVNEGDTLRLPCLVDRLEGFVLLWRKDGRIISVGNELIDKVWFYNDINP